MNPAETLLQALDEAATGPLLVFGSLPPAGRDLDLLVRDDDLDAASAALAAAGAVRRGDTWAIFGDGTAYATDLIPVSSWGLPQTEVDALWEAASPLDGYRSLVAPSPAHTLLLLARTGFAPKRGARLREALAVPGARTAAEARASAWNVSLEVLGAARRQRPPVGPPRVVALSGLDGSGKSTQSRALVASLEALGYRVHVEWSPILQNRSIELLSSLARVVLRVARRGSAPAEGESLVARVETSSTRHATVSLLWTSLVALVNAAAHRRPALAHRGRATVVLYDRFVLDSIVRLRFLYGRDNGFGPQRRILQTLSPRPAAAYWLDVPAERAFSRKPEHWDVDDLAAQRSLYAEEHARLGVTRLDGERPPHELAAEIAADVWQRL